MSGSLLAAGLAVVALAQTPAGWAAGHAMVLGGAIALGCGGWRLRLFGWALGLAGLLAILAAAA